MSLCSTCGRTEGDDSDLQRQLPPFAIYRGCPECDAVWIEEPDPVERCDRCGAVVNEKGDQRKANKLREGLDRDGEIVEGCRGCTNPA